ncbi:hypothetical protein F2P81_001660 [Scophthalmus maximus]|uniref:HAP1 N-terminal domain-containing protein n=1 Tax=Scophthalmus maximus TaxID=52904 RepID=A0A6A4TQU0_SCOMX|nr:hypothetical protein F2P81_001660 [Scophthalmus maximus]
MGKRLDRNCVFLRQPLTSSSVEKLKRRYALKNFCTSIVLARHLIPPISYQFCPLPVQRWAQEECSLPQVKSRVFVHGRACFKSFIQLLREPLSRPVWRKSFFECRRMTSPEKRRVNLDVCNSTDLPELEIISLLEEQLPVYKLRADTIFGYEQDDWLHTPLVEPDSALDLTTEQIEETLKYFCKLIV